jgi:hypothetical protein
MIEELIAPANQNGQSIFEATAAAEQQQHLLQRWGPRATCSRRQATTFLNTG